MTDRSATAMQNQLNSLTKEFTSTAASAQRTLRGLFGNKAAAAAAPIPEGVPTAKLRPGYGGATAAAPGGTGETALGDEADSRGIMYRVSPSFIRARTPQRTPPVPTPEPGVTLPVLCGRTIAYDRIDPWTRRKSPEQPPKGPNLYPHLSPCAPSPGACCADLALEATHFPVSECPMPKAHSVSLPCMKYAAVQAGST